MLTVLPFLFALIFSPYATGHIAAWHPSMWGFNVTDAGNRPQDPLMNRTFNQWWFHNHLDHPPHPSDFLNFPAGGVMSVETTCDKGATSYWATNPGGKLGDVVNGDDPCPGSPPSEYHTTNKTDVKGCAFAIAYIPPSQVQTIKPEDFTIFSVNQTCVWYRHTSFQVPANMPACPPGGCTCAWFWIHAADSGSEQIYMNGYQCNITGATSTTPIAQPQVARRCGKETEPDRIGTKPQSATNCTYGAKQPLYWDNIEGNNEFEDGHHPPFYNDLYNYVDGAQKDIFVDSPLPSMTWAGAPTGVLKPVAGQFGASTPTPTPVSSSLKPKITPHPSSQAHAKGCKCHKCRTKTVTVTHTVHANCTEEIRTISPEEANSILSMATSVANATETIILASPSSSSYVRREFTGKRTVSLRYRRHSTIARRKP